MAAVDTEFWLYNNGRKKIEDYLHENLPRFVLTWLQDQPAWETLQNDQEEVIAISKYLEAAIAFECYTSMIVCTQIYLTPWEYRGDAYLTDLKKSMGLDVPNDAMFKAAGDVCKKFGIFIEFHQRAVQEIIPLFTRGPWKEIANWIFKTSKSHPPAINIISHAVDGWDFALRLRNHYSMRLGIRMLAFDTIEMITMVTRILGQTAKNQSLQLLNSAENNINEMLKTMTADGRQLFSDADLQGLVDARAQAAEGQLNVLETTRTIYIMIQNIVDSRFQPLEAKYKENLTLLVEYRNNQKDLINQLEQERERTKRLIIDLADKTRDVATLEKIAADLNETVERYQDETNTIERERQRYIDLNRLYTEEKSRLKELQQEKSRLQHELMSSQVNEQELKDVISHWTQRQLSSKVGVNRKPGDISDEAARLRQLQKRGRESEESSTLGLEKMDPDDLVKLIMEAMKARRNRHPPAFEPEDPQASGDFKTSRQNRRAADRSKRNREAEAQVHIPTTPDDKQLRELLGTANHWHDGYRTVPSDVRKQKTIDLILDWRKQAYLMNSVDFQPSSRDDVGDVKVGVPPVISPYQKYLLNWVFSQHPNLKQQHQEWIRQWILREQQKALALNELNVRQWIEQLDEPDKKNTNQIQTIKDLQKKGDEIINDAASNALSIKDIL